MANDRKSAKDTAKRILADSANAKHRFGFAGEFGSPIKSAPKLSDLWFIEYKSVSGGKTSDTSRISALAKSVSPISINTSTMAIDQYGKRVHVPTRVDFPEVGITMWDTVDGKMFDIAEDIYSKFFKNQDAKFTGANAEQVLTDSHAYGRRIPDPDKHNYYHQHFEKITIYHFFGNLEDSAPPGKKDMLFGARATAGQGSTRTGYLQKIELINPLVTNITFSPSDYSVSDLRTIDLSVQPENIIIGKPKYALFPDWMTLGMNYMLDELSQPLQRREGDIYPSPTFGSGNREQSDKSREGISKWDTIDRDTGELNKYKSFDQKQSITDPLRIEEQKKNDNNRKLSELMTLYNATLANPNEQSNEALKLAIKERIGVIDLARSNRFSKESTKTYIDKGNEYATPYTATYTNPDIPTFGGIGDSNPGGTQFPRYSTDLGSSMIQELIGAFFSGRKFDVGNIKGALVNKLIGNDGSSELKKIAGQLLTDGMVSSKQGAYATTTKANQSIPTNTPTVYKTNTTDQAIGVSKALLRRFLNN